jgi:hypothetical protein
MNNGIACERLFIAKTHESYIDLRRNKQHAALTLALDGLYLARDTVKAILAPQEGKNKTVLDLGPFLHRYSSFTDRLTLLIVPGCGSGVWYVAVRTK